MASKIYHTELLYEIALSIGHSRHMGTMMRQSAVTLLRVLNANGCVVLGYEHPTDHTAQEPDHLWRFAYELIKSAFLRAILCSYFVSMEQNGDPS